MGAYIFYTHNTFTNYHVSMAIESIAKQNQDFLFEEFIVYNNSTDIETSFITEQFDKFNLQKNFKKLSIIKSYPKTNSVPADLKYQKEHIIGHQWYFLHKADFYLPEHFLGDLCKSPPSQKNSAYYLNFCKFDLRETVGPELIREMSKFNTFEELANQSYANHTDDINLKYPKDLTTEHVAIGYRGRGLKFDGVMHCYNEEARQKINFSSYWKKEHLIENRKNNIIMEIDQSKYFVLHMFHDIGRTDVMKQTPGHRF